MSFTSQAMIALLVVLILLILRSKFREKDAENAALTTAMAMHNANPAAKDTAPLTLDQGNQVREWTYGDKPEDMLKPGVHVRTHIKIEVTRKKS